MRAIAALLVVFFHYSGPEWLQGWIGVQTFFVLSGFLITTLLLRERQRTGRVSIKDFWLRRAFRILPMYFLVFGLTALWLAVVGAPHATEFEHAVPYYLTFFNEFNNHGLNLYSQSWSIGTEQKFYLLWPLLAFGIGITTCRRQLLLALSGIGAIAIAIPFTTNALPICWPVNYFGILVGCALAIVMHRPRGYAFIRPLTNPIIASAIAVTFIVVHLAINPGREILDFWLGIPGFVWVIPLYSIAVALLLPAIIAPAWPGRMLSSRIMVFIGERSYSVYLMQSIAASCVALLLPQVKDTWRATTVALVALAMATVLYHWVELPMIALGRRLTKRKPPLPPPDPQPAEPSDDKQRTLVGVS